MSLQVSEVLMINVVLMLFQINDGQMILKIYLVLAILKIS